MEDDILVKKIVNLIKNGINNKRWLYWPPGPMVRQVFDSKTVEQEVTKLIKEHNNG